MKCDPEDNDDHDCLGWARYFPEHRNTPLNNDAVREGVLALMPTFGRKALALTFDFNQPMTLTTGKKKLGTWLAILDHEYLGRSYQKRPNDRTRLIALPEHINSNMHYHSVCRPPMFRAGQDDVEFAARASSVWRYVVPSGELYVKRMFDDVGWHYYVTKEMVHDERVWADAVLSWEFHPQR